MPIEINGERQEPYLNLRGVKRRVTFKVATAPLRAKTEEGYVEKPLASLSIPSTYTRMNQSGGHDVIRYYKNKTPNTGKYGELSYNYTPDFIEIENGEKIVDTKLEPDLYWWFLNNPDTEGNPIYDVETNQNAKAFLEGRRSPFLFVETDRNKAKTNAKAFNKDVEVAKCITLISDEDQLNNKNAVALYRAYGYPDADELLELEDYTSIRKALTEQAKVDPKLFNTKMENAALFLEANVNDAVQKGIIAYDQTGDFNGWMWAETSEPKKNKKICPIEAHQYEERLPLLIEFLRTNEKGIKIAQGIKEELLVMKLSKR
jgi:hypothetical protein